MSETCVIVGAGHAAGQAVVSLRANGFVGRIVLVGDEPYLPYQRPPLSKAFLAGDLELERLYFRPPDSYDEHEVELHLETRVTRIDRQGKTVITHSGEEIGYDHLLLTLGSRVRELPIPGVDLAGIHYLRSISDVEAIREYFTRRKRFVIVGGGYIGLEVAAVAVKAGLDVTVLEMAPYVMARVVDRRVAEFFMAEHRRAGVEIKTDVRVSAFEGPGRLTKVHCADGSSYEADFAVIGVGILPNDELAAVAGLTCENGIVVDDKARTSDPAIFAAGDCTNHPNQLLGRRLRLESVHNAIEQAKTAAAAICGKSKPYAQIPWFWSDQYDLKLQIAGLSQGHDRTVLRGDPADRSFAMFYLHEQAIIAVDAINSPREFMGSKKLIAEKTPIDPDRLADPGVSMRELA